MQSIAKQVTLALTATHKTVKSRGYLAVTLAWVQKAGINGVRDKVLVWLELRNTQHDLWYIPSQNTSGKKQKKTLLSCLNAVSHWTVSFGLPVVYWKQNFILSVCYLD